MNIESILIVLGLATVAAPALLLAVLGIASVIGHPLSEKDIGWATQSAMAPRDKR